MSPEELTVPSDGGEAVVPIVFTDEFVADLRRRYEGKPSSYRSDLYYVGTSPDRSGLRAWVEAVVWRVPQPGRAKLIPRLRSDQHLANTLNELAVGAALQTAGRVAMYEHDLAGATPDWYVPGSADHPPVIVEVWSKNHEQRAVGRRRQWQALRDRVSKIPVGVVLNVLSQDRQGPPSTDVAKELVRHLRAWVAQGVPAAGSQIVLPPPNGSKDRVARYRFRVAGELPGATHALLTLPGDGGAYSTADALAQIETKIARYAFTAVSTGAAFVVVIAAQPGTPISKGTLRNIVDGRQSLEVVIDPHAHGQIADITLPMNAVDEPRSFNPAMSALGWVQLELAEEPTEQPTIDLELFPNPARSIEPPVVAGV